MKVVIISHENKNPLNLRLNAGFVNKLSRVCKCDMVDAYNKKSGIIHSPEYITEKFNPDVVVCHAHNRHLQGYFKKFKCLKAMVAVDAWKRVRDNDPSFYIDNNFDIIFYRTYYDVEFHKKTKTEGVWLPFSASENEFYPDPQIERKNVVGFAGSTGFSNPNVYVQRKRAIRLLKSKGLIDFRGRIEGDEYPKYLRSVKAALSTTDDKDCVHGKAFETIASGTLLFTSESKAHNILFNTNNMVEFKSDCSDIVKKSKSIKKMEVSGMVKKMYEDFLSNHTDTIRIKEMHHNLENMLKGKEGLLKKWEI